MELATQNRAGPRLLGRPERGIDFLFRTQALLELVMTPVCKKHHIDFLF